MIFGDVPDHHDRREEVRGVQRGASWQSSSPWLNIPLCACRHPVDPPPSQHTHRMLWSQMLILEVGKSRIWTDFFAVR